MIKYFPISFWPINDEICRKRMCEITRRIRPGEFACYFLRTDDADRQIVVYFNYVGKIDRVDHKFDDVLLDVCKDKRVAPYLDSYKPVYLEDCFGNVWMVVGCCALCLDLIYIHNDFLYSMPGDKTQLAHRTCLERIGYEVSKHALDYRNN